MRILFTLTIFLGSLLLFLVQPLIAKMVLPSFGGVPAVWNTSLVFFQALLLAGYAYAHFGPKWLGPRAHFVLHLALFAAAFLTLPFGVSATYNPYESPLPVALTLLQFLAVAVGLPYFAISAGAPLLQKWFARTSDPAAQDPYFLYAASNIGSFAALLGYPLWFEPALRLADQAVLWKWAFLGLGVCIAICGALAVPRRSEERPADPTPPPDRRMRLRWVLLAAAPTSLLLGVTNTLTSNVASIPLLWVVPLALYLLTYVLAFTTKRWLSAEKWGRLAALLLAPMTVIVVLEATEPFWLLASVHLLVFFLASVMCHTELAESRPAADHLTEFYLWISLGGVVGGSFNAFLAPILFTSYLEYQIALVAVAALRPLGKHGAWKRFDWVWPVAVSVAMVGMLYAVRAAHLPPTQLRTAITMGLPAVLCFLAIDGAYRYALSVAAFFATANVLGLSLGGRLVAAERSFFGIHRVMEPYDASYRTLVHGNTIHGRQSRDPVLGKEPLTYYHPTGPIGEALAASLPGWPQAELGFVGLGIGSLAAYGRPGDHITFFEIDPTVIQVATDPNLFTFVSDSEARVEMVEGDARVSLRDEPDGKFDLLVLDAFSSDSIPVHLLTVEAIELYFRKLKPGRYLAFHISNRYLQLSQVLAGAAQEKGYSVRHHRDAFLSDEETRIGKTSSEWLFLAQSEDAFAPLDAKTDWETLAELQIGRPWTDDRSNLLEAWKGD